MPIIQSAKKRVKVAEKAAIRNSKTKRTLRTALKAFKANITGDTINKAQSALDQAVKKGVIHKNKAARQKKRLAAEAKSTQTKPAKAKTVAKKPAAKKTVAKKSTTKK